MYTSVQVMGSEPPRPIAEILTIGDELNRGEVIDTNAAWLGDELTTLGFDVRHRQGVCDRPADIGAALLCASGRSQVVVVTGGLGPTSDDLTVDVAADVCGVAVIEEPAHRLRLEERFAARRLALTPNNLRQVRVPMGAEVLHNAVGLAPGFTVRVQQTDLFFLPGIPREMKPMFQSEVVPRLRALVSASKIATVRRTYRVIGLGESHVDHRLRDLLDRPVPAALLAEGEGGLVFSRCTTLHYRLAFPEVLVTLVISRGTAEAAQAALDVLDGEVRHRLGGALYSEGADDLPVVVGRKLRERAETVATAESCTGGMIGQLLTAVAGSSSYYVGGVISYANEVKTNLLGVSQETLRDHGAVSQPCVEQMAQGVRRLTGATYGVAVSGVAGPDGGSADKPVGTVHIAVAGPDGVEARHVLWPGDREQVRRVAACAALNLLDKVLTPARQKAAAEPALG